MTAAPAAVVSIVIPVWNKLAFTRQCLDRIWRNTSPAIPHEVIVVDNGSTDGTEAYFGSGSLPGPVRYHRHPTNLGFAKGNNAGARLSAARYLLFLNNDTLVQPGWLEAMVRVAEADPTVGVVGIKQLFPYTDRIHHTGIVLTAGGAPLHLYPHANAALPHVNKQREYQAVNGACLLIARALFEQCGGFDEGYRNGYEDVDLCLAVRERGRKVVCCTGAFVYHYGQITEGRTADDPANAARFGAKWRGKLRVDDADYFRQDAADIQRAPAPAGRRRPLAPPEAFYLADDLSEGSALAWAVADLARALVRLGVPVALRRSPLTRTLPAAARSELEALMAAEPPVGGTHVRWSHYWPRHLAMDLAGDVNLEFFVINYLFGRPGSQPWDYWLQCLRQNHYGKLPVTRFCRDVLLQVGVPEAECDIVPLAYSPEVHDVPPIPRAGGPFRFLTVTNSHDLSRYGTPVLLEAYWDAFEATDDVVLVVKDYGATSPDSTLREMIQQGRGRAAVEYRSDFTSKLALIGLYRESDAYVSAHRAEGFGMKILDALACGLPVVTPLFGGPADFCTPDNSLPVAWKLAPIGDCLDRRSIRLTNQPMWGEPDRDDLARQLRFAFENRPALRVLGERGRRDVLADFSWDAAARRLVAVAARAAAERPRPAIAAAALEGGDAVPVRSPYWLGCRISVIVPTYNRCDILLECLRALETQSILPEEFEVLVVDDGSTDGTEAAMRAARFRFPFQYHRQANQGPGAARNFALGQARGELVLFIGDDIIPEDRFLEHHLLAHARHPGETIAILGHTDWPPWLQPNAVMEYVCGEGTHQFAYDYIPTLPALDYRFFYTSNISLKRRFLVEAAAAGIRFDPCFRYAAFEDSELAYRLQTRGLEIRYEAGARAYHDHFMDLESFCRREYNAGQMAVVFYRKHPQLDDILAVRWIGEWVDTVEALAARPELLARVKAFDVQTDRFLVALERSLEELRGLEASLAEDRGGTAPGRQPSRAALNRLLGLIFDVHRTRGKVQEWYGSVENPDSVDAARALLASAKKLQFLGADGGGLGGGLPGLDAQVVSGLASQGSALDRELGGQLLARLPAPPGPSRLRSLLRRVVFARRLFHAVRAADRSLRDRLASGTDRRWLDRYHRLRSRLKRLV